MRRREDIGITYDFAVEFFLGFPIITDIVNRQLRFVKIRWDRYRHFYTTVRLHFGTSFKQGNVKQFYLVTREKLRNLGSVTSWMSSFASGSGVVGVPGSGVDCEISCVR